MPSSDEVGEGGLAAPPLTSRLGGVRAGAQPHHGAGRVAAAGRRRATIHLHHDAGTADHRSRPGCAQVGRPLRRPTYDGAAVCPSPPSTVHCGQLDPYARASGREKPVIRADSPAATGRTRRGPSSGRSTGARSLAQREALAPACSHLLEMRLSQSARDVGLRAGVHRTGYADFRRRSRVRLEGRTAYLDVYAEDEMVNFELDGRDGTCLARGSRTRPATRCRARRDGNPGRPVHALAA